VLAWIKAKLEQRRRNRAFKAYREFIATLAALHYQGGKTCIALSREMSRYPPKLNDVGLCQMVQKDYADFTFKRCKVCPPWWGAPGHYDLRERTENLSAYALYAKGA
jgi:hypothetical protein